MTLPLSTPVDVLIVGGGVNGAGIARDLVGRGCSVLLCEMNDLASATSSASTKLIHGGLRYLEYYQFRLVRESLKEREVLLGLAPHIIWPLRFVLPHSPEQRPAWLIRLGLFLYDNIGGRKKLPPTRAVDLRSHLAGQEIKPAFAKAFAYSDCWVEDSRLVMLNALDAQERGATILTRTRLVHAKRESGLWLAVLENTVTGERHQVQARCLVNAAGPWVAEVLNARIGLNTKSHVRLVKGSHIVVPRLYEGNHAYILQNEDRRIVFAIPYEQDFTLIGTTDVDYREDPAAPTISEDEVAYLCRSVSRYFKKPVTPQDVVWTYSGVRPLYDDDSSNPSAITRDYVLEMDAPHGQAPVLSVFGGKITTYRRLAEHAVDKILPVLGRSGASWTASVPLPGGDIPDADFDLFLQNLKQQHPWLPPELARRYARAYGTRTARLLNGAQGLEDLGMHFGANVYEVELHYAIDQEFVQTADDFLWRRTRMGLHLMPDESNLVAEWFGKQVVASIPST